MRSLKALGLLLATVIATSAAQISLGSTPAAAATVPDGTTVAGPLQPSASAVTSGYRLWYDDGAKADMTALENAYPQLKPVALGSVLDAADRVGRPPQCPSAGYKANDGVLNSGARGFCWDALDTGSDAGFTPQGVTTNATPFAAVDGRQVVAASWYKTSPLNSRIRVTFADTTDPAHVRYVHALLVVPDSGAGTFTGLTGHGDDLVWYKNRLFVGFGQGFHVFDLDHIWKVDAAGTGMGRSTNGTFAAEGFGYVLPAVGTFAYANPAGCGTFLATPSPNPCNAGASLDLSGPVPVITTTEVTSRANQGFVGVGGKIVHWPLDPSTGLLRTTAESGGQAVRAIASYSSPIVGAQGVVSSGGTHLISAPCPEYVEWVPGGPDVPAMNSCVYRALPGQPVQLWKRASVHLQNLAYDAQRDALWFLNEYPGQRVVYQVPWPRFAGPLNRLVSAGDLTGDGRPDLLSVDAAGKLWQHSGTGTGGYTTPVSLGGGWGSFTGLVGAGDLNRDGKPDLLAREPSGELWRYPGTGTGGFGNRVAMGGGWDIYTSLVAAGDLNGDGDPDLLAVDGSGQLWRYPGAGNGGFGNRVAMGGGWNAFTSLVGTGDLTGDGTPDLLAVDGSGQLRRYPGAGNGGFGNPVAMGGGWDMYDTLVGAGDLTGDGKPDLLARERAGDGKLWSYAGTGAGGFANRAAWTF